MSGYKSAVLEETLRVLKTSLTMAFQVKRGKSRVTNNALLRQTPAT